MTPNYPPEHTQIVSELLNGKFILEQSPHFAIIQKNLSFYKEFFQASFAYTLNTDRNYFFLTSKEATEEGTRDLLLFLALLAYELHNEQRNFVKELTENAFDVVELEKMVRGSSKYNDLLKGSSVDEFENFVKKWNNRNLISFINARKQQFRFNAPIQTFLEVAEKLCQLHLEGGLLPREY